MSDVERTTFSSPLIPGHRTHFLHRRRPSSVSIIAIILSLKAVGLIFSVLLVVVTIVSQTHPEIVNLQPVLDGSINNNHPDTPALAILPTMVFQTEMAILQTETARSTLSAVPVNPSSAIGTPLLTQTQIETQQPTHTPTLSMTPTNINSPTPTLTSVPTDTLTPTWTNTPTITLTFTPSATLYPYSLTTYNAMMSTPLQGIGFGELHTIISQAYNVPDPYKDTGHHGVDLGSYEYHGKLIYDWPILSMFSGKVAGIVVNRPPIGNCIIIESTQEQLPMEIITLTGIKTNQSLYHMYCHMFKRIYSQDWGFG